MSAWKACDIRGPYPGEVNADLIRSAANAVAAGLKPGSRVLTAGDFRVSTPELRQAVIEGVTQAGADVIDAGQIPTPVAYFAHGLYGSDAVLIVTASHNPASHNGLKILTNDLPPSPEDLMSLRMRPWTSASVVGTLEQRDPVPAYLDWIIQRWKHLETGTRLRVVLDAGNGAWYAIAPTVFRRLGFYVHPLFCSPDGRFPNRIPDCSRPEGVAPASEAVVRMGCDFAAVWDGDGDRVAFVDEMGAPVSSDEIALLLIRKQLENVRDQTVIYDLKMSDAVRRCIENLGNHGVIERSGHTFLKRRMILEDGIFGCEASGHYFYRELRGGDDGLFTALLLASIVQESGPLHALRKSLPSIFITRDIRIPLRGVPVSEILNRVRSQFEPEEELTLDGVRIHTKDGYVLARPSVTEPVISVRIEGFNRAALSRLVKKCTKAFPADTECFAESEIRGG
jgi:phosphomannomutase / phosphoglucomutase